MNYVYEQFLIDLGYGLFFFLIGYSIFVVRPARVVNCTLSKSLWLLGMFGLLHGLGEWTRPLSTLPLDNTFMSPLASLLGTLIISVSFIFLLLFGVSLLNDFVPSKVISKGIALFFISSWLLLVINSYDPNLEIWLKTSKAWGRYFLGFPGAFITALAFLIQYLQLRGVSPIHRRHPQIKLMLLSFVVVFFCYAIFSLVGRFTPFFPNSLLNKEVFENFFNVPVEIVRTFFGFTILLCTLKALTTFHIVHSQKLQAALKKQSVNEAKSKISQDLHDTTIQSIYATGLRLKYIKRKLDPALDSEMLSQLDHCANSLNNTIKHLRFYITALEYPDFYKGGLKNTLLEIVAQFKKDNAIQCQVISEGENREVPLVYLHQIVQITKEALNNVAKHSEATEIKVELRFEINFVTISIIDNGKGFSLKNYLKERQSLPLKEENSFGLKNIEERAGNIGAKVHISSEIGVGTKIYLKVPYGGDQNGKNQIVNS